MAPSSSQGERFLSAIRSRDAAAAGRLLERHPGVARANVFTACCTGAADFVAEALAAEPGLATAGHAPDGWPPLLYLCSSTFHSGNPERARGILRCAELLLGQGADPNSHTLFDAGDPQSKLPALYFACVSDNVPVVRLLLERGAEPNDGESVYHAAELNRRECLELLLAHGADISGRHLHWGNTPLYFLAGYKEADANRATAAEGMRWLLEHGADPNVVSLPSGEAPLHRIAAWGSGAARAELLLAHGANPDLKRADGRTAYVLAVRAGNVAVADLLRERGADTAGMALVDELLGACMRADAAAARRLLRRHPRLLAELTAEDRQVVAQAAEEGREAGLRLMAELGFDLGWEGAWAGTALHQAAWRGNVPVVRLLLELGAPVNVRDTQFGCSPLAWAAHGSCHCRKADGEYLAVVEALIAAGADRETSINRWGEPPETMGSRRVNARLRKWAAAAPSAG
jgi:ankyrin repeat protein